MCIRDRIESVILEMEEFEPHYLLIGDRKNNTDTMELQVEVRPEYYSDEINKMLALKTPKTKHLLFTNKNIFKYRKNRNIRRILTFPLGAV